MIKLLKKRKLDWQDFIRASPRKLTLAWRVYIVARRLTLMHRIWNDAKCLLNSKLANITQMFILVKHLANIYKISLSNIS